MNQLENRTRKVVTRLQTLYAVLHGYANGWSWYSAGRSAWWYLSLPGTGDKDLAAVLQIMVFAP